MLFRTQMSLRGCAFVRNGSLILSVLSRFVRARPSSALNLPWAMGLMVAMPRNARCGLCARIEGSECRKSCVWDFAPRRRSSPRSILRARGGGLWGPECRETREVYREPRLDRAVAGGCELSQSPERRFRGTRGPRFRRKVHNATFGATRFARGFDWEGSEVCVRAARARRQRLRRRRVPAGDVPASGAPRGQCAPADVRPSRDAPADPRPYPSDSSPSSAAPMAPQSWESSCVATGEPSTSSSARTTPTFCATPPVMR